MSSEWATFIFLLLVILATADIIRRAIMTVARDRQEQRNRRAMRRLTRKKQPQVTVLVYSSGQVDALKATLRSIRHSKYAAYDVVVADEQRSSKKNAYREAYRKSKKGTLVVLLTAGELLDPYALKRAVVSRNGRSRWRVPVRLREEMHPGIVGVVTRLQSIVWGSSPTVEASTAKALKSGNVRPTLGVREEMSVLASIMLGVALLLSAYAGDTMIWYLWVVFSGYLFALLLVHTEMSGQAGKLILSIPSALFLIPITAFFKEISQQSTRK